MKKRISILLILILAITFLAACGGGGAANFAPAEYWSGAGDTAAPTAIMPMPEEAVMYDMAEQEYYDDAAYISSSTGGESPATMVSAPAQEGLAEKIIYSVYADIETMNFDETIENVHALLTSYGAFIENSSVSGVNYAARYHGWRDNRHARFTLRVPVENLDTVVGRLSILGNVVHENRSADNITMQFHDTQSRLNSLRIQEDRLLDMLSKATDVPDLITIEERLGDVRYQVEWLTTMLNNWQRQVDYSNLTLSIIEVEQFTEQTELYRSYWQQISDGFLATVRGVGRFFMDLFKWLIIAAPVLIILAVIAVVIFIIIRRQIRSTKKKEVVYPVNTPANFNDHVYKPPEPPDSPDSKE